ncbi:hypothetical protein LSH36_236g00000 [Paralvinella palmiformis]|uniref:Major facilitator superfamily (MFS) profile domain-containing protein n=1 Tax=Paralvinella palmiformis TaxID=53620 RepID=A0AAD9JLS5_9ANNE|nr:hypothetical protein LSH36_236g00000 [Paralvinella palmiformis]
MMADGGKIFDLPLVKFRKSDRGDYEDLGGDASPTAPPSGGLSSPTSVKQLQEDTFTVDQAVDAIGFGKFQIKLSFFTGLVWMADAMEMMILSILAPALHCDWNLTPFLQALLTTVVFAGMMVSSSLWGTVCDKYGRKAELILCSMFTFYYGILSALAPNYIWLLILRGLVGFGIGGVPQSVTLYAEFLPTSTRAKCVVMIEIFWAIGACFIVFISIFVMPSLGWRYLLGIAAIPLLIFAISCVWLPESVRYDMACGNHTKALETLKRIAADNGKPMPLGRLVETGGNVDGSVVQVKRGQLFDLFTKELRVTTLLLWFIWLANAFSYYGIVLMTTELFETEDGCHGGHTVSARAAEPACSLECKQLTTKDYTDLLWTTVAEFPGLFITFLIIEWLGRRWTMAVEFCVFSFFVFLVNMCTSRTLLTFFLFVARAFISGAFQAAYVYTPEVYPTTTRALGLGSCSGMARIGALVTPFVAQVLLRTNVYIAINLYAAVCILGAIAAALLPIETKGREMKDTHMEPQRTPSNK